jgi:CRP-like cAMP-binding protein
MQTLRTTIQSLAADFANNVLRSLRTASVEELAAVSGHGVGNGARANGRGSARSALLNGERRRPLVVDGRLARRSQADIVALAVSIAALLEREVALRAEEIRTKLDLDRRELPRALAEGLASGALSKTGEKRATTYSAKRPKNERANERASEKANTRANGRAK